MTAYLNLSAGWSGLLLFFSYLKEAYLDFPVLLWLWGKSYFWVPFMSLQGKQEPQILSPRLLPPSLHPEGP